MTFTFELAKPNVPNKNWRQFTPQALECIADKWNREHNDSEMQVREDGSLIMITRSFGHIENGIFVEDKVPKLITASGVSFCIRGEN